MAKRKAGRPRKVKFKVGDKVRFKDYEDCSDWKEHRSEIATITDIDDDDEYPVSVKWNDGTRSAVHHRNLVIARGRAAKVKQHTHIVVWDDGEDPCALFYSLKEAKAKVLKLIKEEDVDTNDIKVCNTEFIKGSHRHLQLAFTAIDHQQIRHVILFQSPPVSPPQHFEHHAEIVRPVFLHESNSRSTRRSGSPRHLPSRQRSMSRLQQQLGWSATPAPSPHPRRAVARRWP